MAEENTIIINNYAGSGQGPLEEISVGHEVARFEPVDTHTNGWFLSWPDGQNAEIDVKPGKRYTIYEEDA